MDETGLLNQAIGGFLLFFGALGIPQACGVYSLRWAWRKQKKLFLLQALLVAPAIFFEAAHVFWEVKADVIRAGGYRVCGVFGAAALFTTSFGTVFHFALSGGVLFFIRFKDKRRRSRGKELSPA